MQLYKCPKCNNEINIGTENKRLAATIKELQDKISYATANGTTNYCILCEQANRKIEKAIEILKDPNKAPTCRVNKAIRELEA
jgi:hypothetical protein